MSDVIQQLQQLIQPILASPKGQAMAQAIMSQMGGGGGGDPSGQMRGQGTMGRGPTTDMESGDAMAARNQMRPDLPPVDTEAMMSAPREGTTEDELAAAQQAMGSEHVPNTGGVNQGGGINQDGPTPEEAQLLKSNPSPRNMQNFDKLFGKGAAQMVLQGNTGGSTYEDDVRGAMAKPHGPGESDYNDNQGHDD